MKGGRKKEEKGRQGKAKQGKARKEDIIWVQG